jgi:hypothetical protein
MIYSQKSYKIDNDKSSVLVKLQLRVCYRQYKCNGNVKTS